MKHDQLAGNGQARGVQSVLCRPSSVVFDADVQQWMDIEDKSDQAKRAISTGKLNALLRLHTRPINVVVYHGS